MRKTLNHKFKIKHKIIELKNSKYRKKFKQSLSKKNFKSQAQADRGALENEQTKRSLAELNFYHVLKVLPFLFRLKYYSHTVQSLSSLASILAPFFNSKSIRPEFCARLAYISGVWSYLFFVGFRYLII